MGERIDIRRKPIRRLLQQKSLFSIELDKKPSADKNGPVNLLTGTQRSIIEKPFYGKDFDTSKNQAIDLLKKCAGAGSALEFDKRNAVVVKTSSGTVVVNLKQVYKGIPIFQMNRTVRFGRSETRITGDHVPLSRSSKYSTKPDTTAAEACLSAAKAVESLHTTGRYHSHWRGSASSPKDLIIKKFRPKIKSMSSKPPQSTFFSKGKVFGAKIPAHLIMFYEGLGKDKEPNLRLGWHFIFTLPRCVAQYRVIVSADRKKPEILSAYEISSGVVRSVVYKINPQQTPREDVDFPVPLDGYPLDRSNFSLPYTFPEQWVDNDETSGPSTVSLNTGTSQTYQGIDNSGQIIFFPDDPTGDDQKVLNAHYFCCYLHDFFYMLGFDETSGDFSGDNDKMRVRVNLETFGYHVANINTEVNEKGAEMNMWPFPGTGRHPAFDSDVIGHEYSHAVTNRLIGGKDNVDAMDELQTKGMGEGYGDYFSLTIQNIDNPDEKQTIGNWVARNRWGLRNYPYNETYPYGFGDLGRQVGSMDLEFSEHDMGEIWCACLMSMHRRFAEVLGNATQGKKAAYQLGWQIVIDSLKSMPANANYLEARDNMLEAIREMRDAGQFNEGLLSGKYSDCYGALWKVFAGFGMGANASSADASVDAVMGDNTIPSTDMDLPEGLRGNTINRWES